MDQEFQFTIDRGLFYDKNQDNYPLVFSVVEEYEPLPKWLEFDEQKNLFKGTPDTNDKSTIKIKATNYAGKFVTDIIVIDPKVSSTYIFRLIFTYAGILFSLLGLIKYSNKIYNIFYKSRYQHFKVLEAEIGEEFT